MDIDNGRLHFAAGIDNSSLRKDAEQSRSILHGITTAAEQEGNKIDSVFNRIGKTVIGVFSVQQAANFARQIINVRGEIESLQKSFEILAGKNMGAKLFSDIKDFAVNTPMMMNDIAKGAQTLLSFNVAAEEVMPILRAIGDISMGDAQKFNSLTLAFSQMSSTGRLMGQDLLQMINAGFNPLSVIAEKTGKSIGDLKEEMAAGSLSAEQIKQAFMDAASECGKFNNMLLTQSKGVKGSISNLQGAIDDMMNSIGQNAQGIITGSIQAATALVKNYERLGEVIAELIATYGVYKAALITINALKTLSASLTAGWTAAELAHYNALMLVEKAQALLNATIMKNPYVLAAAAVAALAYGIYKLVTAQTDAEKAQERLNKTTSNMNKEIASERVQIDSLFARLKAAKEGTDEYKVAKQAIISQYGDYLKGLKTEVSSLKDVEAAYKAVSKAAQDAAKARAMEAATKDAADTYATEEAEAKDAIYEALIKAFGSQTGSDGMRLAETYYWQIIENLQSGTSVDANLLKKFDKKHIAGDLESGIGSYEYTTNIISESLDDIKRARAIYEETIAEAQRRFGDVPQTGTDESSEAAKNEIVKNKKYWEDYKKEQQGLLDSMTEAQLQTEEASQIRKNITEAQEKIDAYSVSKGITGAANEQREESQLAIQAAERTQKIREYGEAVARESRIAELEIEQARIDGMNEGLEKELAQSELNYKRLVEANVQRQEEMVERLRDKKELEWENANPKAKEQGLTFDRSSVTAADLSQEQLAIINEYTRIAEESRQRANKESLDKMLSEVMTYEQKRTEISQEYERKRSQLYTTDKQGNKVFREGVTQGNADELDRQEKEAMSAIDEQFAQREASYRAWCEQVATLSLNELEAVLKQAEEELENLQKSGTADGEQIAVARAKVETAKNSVANANAKKDLSPNKRTLKEWEDLYSVLNDCNQSFERIGDSVGGVVGEIMETSGMIMSSTLSMINGIVQLVNMSSTGIVSTTTTAAAAISTMEKASVILAVISAAMQIAMTIVNLFNQDDKYQEEIDRLQNRIDQLQWELNNANTVRLQENQFKALELAKDVTTQVRMEMVKMKFSIGDIAGAYTTMYKSVSKDSVMLSKSIDMVAKAYAGIPYTADKALKGADYDSAKNQLGKISEQIVLLKEQIDNELKKKHVDDEEVAKMEQQIEELGQNAIDVINNMVEGIIGGSSDEISEQLGNAFFDAFEAGEDAAEAWHQKVNDIVKDITKRMFVKQFLEEPLGEIFNKYKNKWFQDDGTFNGLDAVVDSMGGFASDLNVVGDRFAEIWDAMPDNAKNMFTTTAEATREASESGGVAASQESMDEYNGRATAIQGHTYTINENMKLLVGNSAAILISVQNIERYSEAIALHIAVVESEVNNVKGILSDMEIKGIKIK